MKGIVDDENRHIVYEYTLENRTFAHRAFFRDHEYSLEALHLH